MKLLRFGANGKEQPGMLDEHGAIRDLSKVVEDLNGDTIGPSSLAGIAQVSMDALPKVEGSPRIGPCVGNAGKLVCIGLNYVDHAREAGLDIPDEPVIFMKATSAICGPNDDIEIPSDSVKTDWEVELGIVIGSKAKRVPVHRALSYVAGYCLVDDLSERNYQLLRGGQWIKGKSLDTYGPIGPWLVTRDEIPNPNDLHIWQKVDGVRVQDGSTSDMIFNVSYLISYTSQFMTLHPGDIISTGTPAGVGLGQKPEPVFLHPGQTIELGIDNLGIQKHRTTISD